MGVFSVILSILYSIKHLDVTMVVNWWYVRKTETQEAVTSSKSDDKLLLPSAKIKKINNNAYSTCQCTIVLKYIGDPI